MRIPVLLSVLFCSTQAFAAPLRFPDHNFSIEMPETWVPISPQPPEVLAAVQSPDAAKKLLVAAVKLSPLHRSSGADQFRRGMKKGMTSEGWQIDPDRPLTIGDLPFISFATHNQSGITGATYTTAAGDLVYVIQTFAQAGDLLLIQNFNPQSRVSPYYLPFRLKRIPTCRTPSVTG
jgi:hypothetical protein